MQRVEKLLRRELSDLLLGGSLRDPRLQPTSAISITGVSVSADLSSARVYIDVLGTDQHGTDVERVLAGLRAGASRLRAGLAGRLQLKHVPTLSFVSDESIGRAARIQQILAEVAPDAAPEDDDDDEGDDDDDGPGTGPR